MTNQVIKPCAYCGQIGTEMHHLNKRSTHPQLIDEEKNLLLLCNRCHRLTEENMDFAEALREIFYRWKPKNADLFMRAQASIEALEQGKIIEFLTPAHVDYYLTLATAQYSHLSEQYGQLEVDEANYFNVQDKDKMTIKAIEMAWRASKNGGKMLVMKNRLKALEKLQSTLKAKLRRFETERFNTR